MAFCTGPFEDSDMNEQQQTSLVNAAKFILKTKEGRKLTQVAMNGAHMKTVMYPWIKIFLS